LFFWVESFWAVVVGNFLHCGGKLILEIEGVFDRGFRDLQSFRDLKERQSELGPTGAP
jgi:hypothetical protein